MPSNDGLGVRCAEVSLPRVWGDERPLACYARALLYAVLGPPLVLSYRREGRLATLEFALDFGDALLQVLLELDTSLDGLHTVHDGRVVIAVEELCCRLVGDVGELLHEIHHHLSWKG